MSPLAFDCIGPADAPVLFLSAGLGGLASYWAPQLEAYAAHHRVVLLDHRGTGRNRADLPDGLAIADMAQDAIEVLDQLGVAQCRFVGHAIGGLIGLSIALARPSLIERMVVVNAWSRTDAHTARCFAARTDLLLHAGIPAFIRAQPIFVYTADWLAANMDQIAREEAASLQHFQGVPTVMRRIEAALLFDVEAELSRIGVPTLVVAARDDVLVPSACSIHLAEKMSRGRLAMFDYGGHACNVTQAVDFNRLTTSFLGED